MFDFSFGELLLLAVVALLVLGPERLPKVARLAGLWIRKARAQWNAVKAELENELADEELRRNLREASDAMREGMQKVRALPDAIRNEPVATDTAAVMTSLGVSKPESVKLDSNKPHSTQPDASKADSPEGNPAGSGITQAQWSMKAQDRTSAGPLELSDSSASNAAPAQPQYDPTQLSLLDPDLTMQMILLPPAHEPRPDDRA